VSRAARLRRDVAAALIYLAASGFVVAVEGWRSLRRTVRAPW